VAVRARPPQSRYGGSFKLKRLLLPVAGLVIAVVLVVLFVPGVQDYIEAQVLGWLARLAG
jgi:hypothetical protein